MFSLHGKFYLFAFAIEDLMKILQRIVSLPAIKLSVSQK